MRNDLWSNGSEESRSSTGGVYDSSVCPIQVGQRNQLQKPVHQGRGRVVCPQGLSDCVGEQGCIELSDEEAGLRSRKGDKRVPESFDQTFVRREWGRTWRA